eukprot:g8222.t1
MCVEQDVTDQAEVLRFLKSTTLVGILPVPHPIVIRTYQASGYTSMWFTSYMWGVIFTRSQRMPLYDWKKIRLAGVSQFGSRWSFSMRSYDPHGCLTLISSPSVRRPLSPMGRPAVPRRGLIAPVLPVSMKCPSFNAAAKGAAFASPGVQRRPKWLGRLSSGVALPSVV